MSSSRDKPHVAPFVGPAWSVAAAWLALALLAQATVVHYLAIRNVVPSFVLVVVVWYAIRVDARRAAIYGLVAGLCEDALSAQTGAAWTIATTLGALVASVLSRGFFADSIPLASGIVLVVTLLRALIFWTVMALGGYPGGLGAMHLREALLQAALNVAVIVAAMLVLRRFDAAA
ncbi:MAG TPA: rod shape-determining protein MreD [Candidatus Baltobacteraceae bacterium]|nr:rod shape-determining protein MreD [Candidatus Baltobacteraceae bacterium]